jgi:transglutaminase-like putative cysteine protease
MQFNTYFRFTSYATVAAAALALFVAGAIGLWLLLAFALLMFVAWRIKGTRWQLTERVALIVILISLPILYLDWRVFTPFLLNQFGDAKQLTGPSPARGNVEVAVLAHLILFLSAVKLWQRKADRDWFFLYLISFFEMLLAAGLTTNPAFLATLILYLLCALSTVVAFEIQKARRKVRATQTRLLLPPDSALSRKLPVRLWRRRYLETQRLPLVSIALLVLIVVLALPFFLIAPRTASSALRRGGNGVSGFIGFSDNVTLGEIGNLKKNDEIFMHVRVESGNAESRTGLHWRGVALDEFTGRSWRKSAAAASFEEIRDDRGFFKLGTTDDLNRLTAQAFYVEPVDTPVLFGTPRVLAVQGNLPFVRLDSEGAIQTRLHDQERVRYEIYSDTSEPNPRALRLDRLQYVIDSARYLELPANLDPRIGELAASVIRAARAGNGYDAALAIESHLRNNYGYSLDLKAGGRDPLADFLFNVKTGHCEYFSTAMAVMLRTQGIASRVVNGFLPGEYNEAAAAYTVRQSDAHSWVEVYFPQTKSWVTFDPTPASGRNARVRTGLAGALSKYSEALELMWFQYVVGYDKQEQHSLLTSVRKELLDLQRQSFGKLDQARGALPFLIKPMLIGLGSLGALGLIVWLTLRIKAAGWGQGLRVWQRRNEITAVRIDFYERLLRLLEKQGIKRELFQTPLEFAAAVGLNEAQAITNAYNRVRFGAEPLSESERRHIEQLLSGLETSGRSK